MKASECRSKSVEELNKELLDVRKEQFNLRMQKKMGQMNKTHLQREVRKKIALIKTILNEKKLRGPSSDN